MLGVGRLSTRLRRPSPSAPHPRLPSPARVTGGRYPAQVSVNVSFQSYIHDMHHSANPYGILFATVDDRVDFGWKVGDGMDRLTVAALSAR